MAREENETASGIHKKTRKIQRGSVNGVGESVIVSSTLAAGQAVGPARTGARAVETEDLPRERDPAGMKAHGCRVEVTGRPLRIADAARRGKLRCTHSCAICSRSGCGREKRRNI